MRKSASTKNYLEVNGRIDNPVCERQYDAEAFCNTIKKDYSDKRRAALSPQPAKVAC